MHKTFFFIWYYLLEYIARSVITSAKGMGIFMFLMCIAKVIPFTAPHKKNFFFTQHSFQQLEYGHSIMVATPTDMKGSIYFHIRVGHHKLWAGQLNGTTLARWKLIQEPQKSPTSMQITKRTSTRRETWICDSILNKQQ